MLFRSAEEHKQADEERKKIIEAKNHGESLIHSAQKTLSEVEAPEHDKTEVEDRIQNLRKAMNEEKIEDIESLSSQLMNDISRIGSLPRKQAAQDDASEEGVVEGEASDDSSGGASSGDAGDD